MNKPLILHAYQLPTNIKLNNHGYKNKHNWVRFTGTKEVVTNTKKLRKNQLSGYKFYQNVRFIY
jgi:hypothetical protein